MLVLRHWDLTQSEIGADSAARWPHLCAEDRNRTTKQVFSSSGGLRTFTFI